MDVAVKLEVHESPLSLVSEAKTQVPVFTKHIIRIDSSDYTPEHEYIQEKIFFTSRFVENAYRKAFKDLIIKYPQIELINLPSPSPRFASMNKEEKTRRYKLVLPKLGHG